MIYNEETIKQFLIDVEGLFPVPLSKKNDLNQLAKKFSKYATLCIESQGDNIISLVAGYTDNVVNDMGYISVVATRKEAQGKGFAVKLIKEFLEICKQKKLRAVHLYAVSSNIAAMKMYRKLGFQEWHIPDEVRPNDVHLIYYL